MIIVSPIAKLWASLVVQLVKNPPAMQEVLVRFLGQEDPLENSFQYSWTSLVAQTVNNLPTVPETWVRSHGWEDPLEEAMATHSSILAWRIPMDKGAWRATDNGVAKSQTQLSE